MVVIATIYKMAAMQMISNILLGVSVLPIKVHGSNSVQK